MSDLIRLMGLADGLLKAVYGLSSGMVVSEIWLSSEMSWSRGFEPPPAQVFGQRVLQLKEVGVSEEDAITVAETEYRLEKKAKKKAYVRLKQIAKLQGKRPPPNPYPSTIKEIQAEERKLSGIVSSILRNSTTRLPTHNTVSSNIMGVCIPLLIEAEKVTEKQVEMNYDSLNNMFGKPDGKAFAVASRFLGSPGRGQCFHA
ncbi:hypothetical protein MLD38_011925 [Melastoma candidum]|uniref:Uncharacterized protein n=1 Tax=Melastoma candidum TaxID=119954 RepID=A0ACB9R4S8_9MYRT|nr:hypothetical protein MLD38_011925 [Melastoma candidum]